MDRINLNSLKSSTDDIMSTVIILITLKENNQDVTVEQLRTLQNKMSQLQNNIDTESNNLNSIRNLAYDLANKL